MLSKQDVIERAKVKTDICEHLLTLYNYSIGYPNTKVIVELGTRTGESTTAFIAAVNDTGGTVYSIDINYKCEELFKDEPRWKFIWGHDLNIGQKWNIPIDVLFIDTDHFYYLTLNELELWTKYIKPDSIILMHDTNVDQNLNPDGKMQVKPAILEFLKRNPEKYSFTELTNCNGLGIIKPLFK
jgi:predicted O-methyltransferase YrrM